MSRRQRLASTFILLAPLAVLALGQAACGTSDEAPKRGGNGNQNDGGGGDQGGDGGEVDGGDVDASDGEAPAYTLGEVCDVLANAQCGSVEACCTSMGVGYDEAGCKTALKKGCESRAAKVAAGKFTFHPEGVDACNAEMATIYGKCQLSWDETADMLLGVTACRNVFAGTKAAGDACTGNEECKPPSDAAQIAVCDSSQCVTRPKFLTNGSDCTLGGAVTCGAGLYCNADLNTKQGKCEPIKAIGAQCDKNQKAAERVECGWGNHCHPTNGICVKGNVAGTSCTEAKFYECESYVCTNNQCAPITVASDALCKGEAGTP